jgi:hypothetical protein
VLRVLPRLACVVLASSCLPLRFQAPTLPVPPAIASPPSLPASRVIERAVLPAEARAAARGLRLRHDTVLAVGPVPASEALSWELLRRLLGRSVVPLLDLSGIEHLSARVEPSARGRELRLEGPLLAATWAAQLGTATHLLVTETLSVGEEPLRVERRYEPTPDELARYQRDLSEIVTRCRQVRPTIERDLVSVATAWTEAEEHFRGGATFFTVPDRVGEREARAAYDGTVTLLNERVATCRSIEASAGGATPVVAPSFADVVGTVARGSFRLVAVPGGELLWSASLARVGANRDVAVSALLDGLLDALPDLTRPAPQEPRASDPQPPTPRRARGRHHRHHEGAR